jgi:hypothetical protein
LNFGSSRSFRFLRYTRKDIEAMRRGYVWYDYFSVPQIKARSAPSVHADTVVKAVESSPAYVQASRFFAALVPNLQRTDNSDNPDAPIAPVTYRSWQSRGWCRTECAARALSPSDSRTLIVKNERMISYMSPEAYHLAPKWAFRNVEKLA